jgi:YspA, cpYpsA-related SLOG family
MKAIVCGWRDFKDWRFLSATLDALHADTPFDRIATGAQQGADTLAEIWARRRGIRLELYHALWRTHGDAAGPIRNQKMLDDEHPDVVIAFPGGRGTADMVRRAKDAGVRVIEVSNAAQTDSAGS